MVGSTLKFIAAGAMLVALTGCTGSNLRGPFPFDNRGDCPPGPKPCPRECPEFPLPPGGPYLTTPGIHQPLNMNTAPAPAPSSGGGEISIKRQK